MPKLLEVNGLKTWFFTRNGVVKAVDGVSISLSEGEALGLVGESGCGKSVSAMSIMRLIPQPPGRIVHGQVLLEGKDLLSLSEDQMREVRGNKIGVVFQDPLTFLNPVLTIGRQISEAIELHMGMSGQQARVRVVELLDKVGLPSPGQRFGSYPHQLSGGMRQRAMIAMAISCNPRLLIADEPTTALDVTIQAQIVNLVKDIRRELGMAVIWITHDLGVVAGLCERVAVMYAGRIVEEAPARDLYKNPHHPYTIGLLRSTPRIDKGRTAELVPINGMPPNLLDPGPECQFLARCTFVGDRCRQEAPDLRVIGEGHRVACWVNVRESQT